jgi:hypothetical protein
MEIIAALVFIAFLIWLLTRSRRGPATPQPPTVHRAPTEVSSRSLTWDGYDEAPRSAGAEECWVPPGREVTVASYTIPGGMLYVGKRLASVAGHSTEPALIDISLPVNRSNPNRKGEGMTCWPSYNAISPACRAAYLEWLAAGRRDPSAYIGYVLYEKAGLSLAMTISDTRR